MATVLERDNWLDKSIDFVIADIIEYDMKRGGLSIIKEEKLLPEKEIQYLESLEKYESNVKIGKIEASNPMVKEGKKQGFLKYRLLFGQANDLADTDILSVKKDAIFVKKFCECTEFGTYIKFVEKNHYEAYMHLNGLECYWKPDGDLDIKGIDDKKIINHKGFMIDVIWKTIQYLGRYDIDGCRKFLVKFMDDYKFKRLPIEYYREFNQQGLYSYIMYDQPKTDMYLDEVYKPLVIGNYNYLNILVPLLNFII